MKRKTPALTIYPADQKVLDLGLGLHMWDIPVRVFMSESNGRVRV